MTDSKPDDGPSASGSGPCYSVEAMSSVFPKAATNGQIFDGKWRSINFTTGPVGIQDESFHAKYCGMPPGYYGYDAAMALAWWFKSAHPHEFQVRVREHKFEYSHKVIATDAVVELDFFGRMPKSQSTSEAVKP